MMIALGRLYRLLISGCLLLVDCISLSLKHITSLISWLCSTAELPDNCLSFCPSLRGIVHTESGTMPVTKPEL